MYVVTITIITLFETSQWLFLTVLKKQLVNLLGLIIPYILLSDTFKNTSRIDRTQKIPVDMLLKPLKMSFKRNI